MHLKRLNNNKGIGAQLAVTLFVREADPAAPPKEYTFATLFKGEELYALVEQLWRAIMQKVQHSAGGRTAPGSPKSSAHAVLSIEESTQIQSTAYSSLEKMIKIQEKEWLIEARESVFRDVSRTNRVLR